MEQIFNVPLRALDRRKVKMQRFESNGTGKGRHHLDHLKMNRRIPHNPLFPDFLPSGLKLGLDQAHHIPLRFHKRLHRPQNLRKRNKGNVNGNKLDPLRNLLRRHIPDIGFFHADHPFVVAQLPCQLSVSHIDRIDLFRSILEHAVRKSSRRRSHVHADLSGQTDSELLHGFF